jgi:hypothetical protein
MRICCGNTMVRRGQTEQGTSNPATDDSS